MKKFQPVRLNRYPFIWYPRWMSIILDIPLHPVSPTSSTEHILDNRVLSAFFMASSHVDPRITPVECPIVQRRRLESYEIQSRHPFLSSHLLVSLFLPRSRQRRNVGLLYLKSIFGRGKLYFFESPLNSLHDDTPHVFMFSWSAFLIDVIRTEQMLFFTSKL